jgi:hypothetical protein
VNPTLAQQVRARAQNRCEYCGIPFPGYRLPFQIDHIIARQHGGRSEADNLAFCCLHRNRHKGPNIAGRDTETGEVVRLFHPRNDVWSQHFQLDGAVVVGVTAIGRATVHVLAMNEPEFLAVREALIRERVWRPLV